MIPTVVQIVAIWFVNQTDFTLILLVFCGPAWKTYQPRWPNCRLITMIPDKGVVSCFKHFEQHHMFDWLFDVIPNTVGCYIVIESHTHDQHLTESHELFQCSHAHLVRVTEDPVSRSAGVSYTSTLCGHLAKDVQSMVRSMHQSEWDRNENRSTKISSSLAKFVSGLRRLNQASTKHTEVSRMWGTRSAWAVDYRFYGHAMTRRGTGNGLFWILTQSVQYFWNTWQQSSAQCAGT